MSGPLPDDAPASPPPPFPATSTQGAWVIVLLLLLLVATVIGPWLLDWSAPRGWEYQVRVTSASDFQSQANIMGASGWEIISLRPVLEDESPRIEMVFKRPRQLLRALADVNTPSD